MEMFFDDWRNLLPTAVVGVSAYTALLLLLRAAGKRTLAKMNAFDLVVTVALGSTLASVLTTKEVALAQGVLAFALLIGMQFAVTWSSVRAHWIRRAVTGEPTLLVHRGELLPEALLRTRVAEEEVLAALRRAGVVSVAAARAVVLETDGSFSVIEARDHVEGEGAGLPEALRSMVTPGG